jgi:phosphoribosylglycinamide formyltransferase-1
MTPRRVAVLLSGRGSNFRAVARGVFSGSIPAEIAAVLSDRADAAGLRRAAQLGLDARFVSPKGRSREDFDAEMVSILREKAVDLVCLAGYMRILSGAFVRSFPMKILNIHPSLLPAFRGLHAQRQALKAGVKIAGATVHFVTESLDDGPIVLQAAVPVKEGDDEESLSRRILRKEHRIYPEAVRLFCQGRLRVEGSRVKILSPMKGEKP